LPWKEFKKRTPEEKKIGEFLKYNFGVKPKDFFFYKMAFLHKSVASDLGKESNERLEFLGDSILDAIVAGHLFNIYPNGNEGDLTRMKSKIVSRDNLSQLGQRLNLKPLIQYNAGQINTDTLCGNAFEAIIGALYLDQGYKKAQQIIIEKVLAKHIDFEAVKNEQMDYKSQLIIWSQKQKKKIEFKVVEEIDYGFKNEYKINLLIDKSLIAQGIGSSKKRAEQNASEKAWKTMFGDK